VTNKDKIYMYIYKITELYTHTHRRGDPKIPGIAKKILFKIILQV